MPKIIKPELIAADSVAGDGTERNPSRRVEEWYSPDGVLLLSFDPINDEIRGAINMVNYLRIISVPEL